MSAGLMTSMTEALQMPAPIKEGRLIPTMNKFGSMLTKVIEPIDQFIEEAARSPHWCLDIGSAYGIHTLAAIEAGAKMVALDLDPRHLEILRSQVPADKQDRVRTVLGAFPDADLPSAEFGAILACRVLHFLDGPTLEVAARKLLDLLVPGGKVYIRAMTPYSNTFKRVIPTYEARRAKGDRWPGFIINPADYIDDEEERANCNSQAHFLDPDVFARTFIAAGFIIERSEFVAVDVPNIKLDGRESVVVIARKPRV